LREKVGNFSVNRKIVVENGKITIVYNDTVAIFSLGVLAFTLSSTVNVLDSIN